jgi:uncharacterized protein (DUF433 family)
MLAQIGSSKAMTEVSDRLTLIGALRSRIVAKLAGVTVRQLWYWHNTLLLEAHAIPGGPGHPRLYSWVDYMKIRAASKLLREGLSKQTIRGAIAFLDRNVPDWYLTSLHVVSGRAIVEQDGLVYTADRGQQVAIPQIVAMLIKLRQEGPLGELREFSDHVDMHPDVVAGNPVIKGTRLETEFISALVSRGLTPERVAEMYHLTPEQVRSALNFVRAAA